MRAFVTGGTGLVGGRLAHALRERGNEVVALVRSPARAEALRALGCELVEGDVRDGAPIGRALEGCDAAFHVAAVYRVGIARRDREAMHETNVRGT